MGKFYKERQIKIKQIAQQIKLTSRQKVSQWTIRRKRKTKNKCINKGANKKDIIQKSIVQ